MSSTAFEWRRLLAHMFSVDESIDRHSQIQEVRIVFPLELIQDGHHMRGQGIDLALKVCPARKRCLSVIDT